MKDNRSEALLFCRICMSVLFLVSGWGKLVDPEAFAATLVRDGMPWPALLTYIGVMIELCGGLAILFGLWTRVVAAMMAVYILATMLIGHRFWSMPMPAYAINQVQFNKNLGLLGGFVLLSMIGPGRLAIDTLMAKKPVMRFT